MKRCYIDSQLINHLCIHFRRDNTERVLAGLLDTADVRCGLSRLYADSKLLIARHKIGKLRSGTLCRTHLGYTSVILCKHSIEEVHSRSIVLQAFIAVICRTSRNGIPFLVGAVRHAKVYDFLYKSIYRALIVCPEGLLLLFRPLGEVFVLFSGSQNQVKEGVHTASVLLHALNGKGEEGSISVIGGVSEYIHGENNIIYGKRLSIREL